MDCSVFPLQAIREGRIHWPQLREREKRDVMVALDKLRLDTLGQQAKAQGSELANTWLWQVRWLCLAEAV